MEPFDLAAFLPFRINRLADRLSREMMPVYRGLLGIGRGEWRVLAHLGAATNAEGIAARDLTGLTAMDKVKVSRAVAALQQRGWVERRVDDGDRRVGRLRLTGPGRAALAGLTPQMLAAEARVLSRLGDADRDRLLACLSGLEAALGLDGPPDEVAGPAPAEPGPPVSP